MKLLEVNHYLKIVDPNYSVFFDRLENKMIEAGINEILGWEMLREFLFFDKNYLLIKKYILENNLSNLKIYDVGCEFGCQSEIFLDMNYCGIDYQITKQINKDLVSYIHGDFRAISIDLNDSFVISNMSLGWYGDKTDYSDLYKNSKYLAISTNLATLSSLEKIFSYKKVLKENIIENPISKEKNDHSLYLFFN